MAKNPDIESAEAREGRIPSFVLVSPVLPRNLLIICFFILGWLVALHLHLSGHENLSVTVLGQAFDMTRESTVPTCWSVLQALAVALTAGAVAAVLRKQGVLWRGRIAWTGAALLFAFIALDDGAAIHERLGSITSLDLMDDLHYPSYPWHVTVAPVLGLGLLTIIVMIWRDLARCRGTRGILILALACYGVSQGIDFVEGIERMSGMAGNPLAKILPGWMVVEEALEIAGTSLFLFVFVTFLIEAAGGLQFVVEGKPERREEERAKEPLFTETV